MSQEIKDAAWVSGIYAVFGIAWILLSDWLFFTLAPGIGEFVFFSVFKGLLFVALSTAVLFVVVQRISTRANTNRMEQLSHQRHSDELAKSLTHQQSLLYRMIEHLPHPSYLHRETREIIVISHTLRDVLGYTLDDIPTLRAWAQKAFTNNVEETYHKLLKLHEIEGAVDEGRTRMLDAQGNPKYFEWHTTYIGKDSEGFKLFLSTANNVTEQITRERELTYESYLDDLTGLHNRRYYAMMLKKYDTMHDVGIVLGDINGLKLINDVFGHQSGDELLGRFGDILKSHFPKNAVIARLGGDEFVVLLTDYAATDIQTIITSIKHELKNVYEEIVPSVAVGQTAKRPNETMREAFARAENKLYKDKIHENNNQTDAMIYSLRRALIKRTDENSDHINNLRALSKPIVESLSLDKSTQEELDQLIELHDIGKISIDSSIFKTTSTLSNAQKSEIRRHCEIGYRIANALPKHKNVAYSILTHHENVDGSGYPFGLTSEEIPLIARIFRVIDSYDIMCTHKHYKDAVSKEKAIEELNRLKGIYYDPHVVDALVRSQMQ